MIDASVIIPVRNGAQWIAEQLEALAAQDFAGSWEVIVADNGSTDDTRDVVAHFARASPVPVQVADASKRAGVCHARNAGALASQGNVLVFCDCDDRVTPGWLSAAMRGAQRGEVVAGVNRAMTWPQDPDAEVLNPGGVLRGTRINAFVGCNFAVRRDAFFELGGFDESLPPYGCDDIEFAVRVAERKMSVAGEEEMELFFRQTTGWRRILRKVFLSAKAETVLWHRHPQQFADRFGLVRALQRMVAAPVVAVRLLAQPKARRRFIAREVITRIGHVVAEAEWAMGRYQRDAVLLPRDAEETSCAPA